MIGKYIHAMWWGMVLHTCNPSIWKAEAGASGVQDQPGLHKDFRQTGLQSKSVLESKTKPCSLMNIWIANFQNFIKFVLWVLS
jgi:hypothetical protein